MAQQNQRIMMVDDDDADAFLLARALRTIDANIDFKHFLDSEEFVYSLDDSSKIDPVPNTLLIDLNMRGINGFGVIKATKANSRFNNTSIVMLTSSERQEDRDEALRLGANRFETKPVTSKEMSELAASFIG